MGEKFLNWKTRSDKVPQSYRDLLAIVIANRSHQPVERLDYGDYGLEKAYEVIAKALSENRRIALYADYDVDGTMSCVSWIWFFKALGFENYVHYIPCRFKEGYGVNLTAIKNLVEKEEAELVITMDTGITANEEAAYCRSVGVDFICTDHHKIQPETMPDCVILNPKQHPMPNYQELCGCGITFVLLRKLGREFKVDDAVWQDILALTGMATICDVVPLNGVNHKLARLGVQALSKSNREVLVKLRQTVAKLEHLDESDVGFRIGPRINAVGRLEHADSVIQAFVEENPDELLKKMETCNDKRRQIQNTIIDEAMHRAEAQLDSPIIFLGGDWHPGVVGIAASRLAEEYWRPVWLFQVSDGNCKGSARSIPGFDVTEAMMFAGDLFCKFGGHQAAGGFTFKESRLESIEVKLTEFALGKKEEAPHVWSSQISYDCELPSGLSRLQLCRQLASLKPFGHGFEEPSFCIHGKIKSTKYYNDKKSGKPKHTAVTIENGSPRGQKVMLFNHVGENLQEGYHAKFIVTAQINRFQGYEKMDFFAKDYEVLQ